MTQEELLDNIKAGLQHLVGLPITSVTKETAKHIIFSKFGEFRQQEGIIKTSLTFASLSSLVDHVDSELHNLKHLIYALHCGDTVSLDIFNDLENLLYLQQLLRASLDRNGVMVSVDSVTPWKSSLNVGFTPTELQAEAILKSVAQLNARLGVGGPRIEKPPVEKPHDRVVGVPEFKHDCKQCVFLGRHDDHDLYFCRAGTPGTTTSTVIARYSNESSEYSSGLAIARRLMKMGEYGHPLAVAFKLAEKLGHLKQESGR